MWKTQFFIFHLFIYCTSYSICRLNLFTIKVYKNCFLKEVKLNMSSRYFFKYSMYTYTIYSTKTTFKIFSILHPHLHMKYNNFFFFNCSIVRTVCTLKTHLKCPNISCYLFLSTTKLQLIQFLVLKNSNHFLITILQNKYLTDMYLHTYQHRNTINDCGNFNYKVFNILCSYTVQITHKN